MKREDFKEVLGFEEMLEVLKTGNCKKIECNECPFGNKNSTLDYACCYDRGYTGEWLNGEDKDAALIRSAKQFETLVIREKKSKKAAIRSLAKLVKDISFESKSANDITEVTYYIAEVRDIIDILKEDVVTKFSMGTLFFGDLEWTTEMNKLIGNVFVFKVFSDIEEGETHYSTTYDGRTVVFKRKWLKNLKRIEGDKCPLCGGVLK